MAERTKLWIADRMKALMSRKSIDKIHITEICREAEIERSTFYYHFQDKYDLVAWIFFQSTHKTDLLDVQSAAEDLRRMKKDIRFYKHAYEDTSQNALWPYMLKYFTDKYTELAREKANTEDLDEQTLFSIRLYCYGAVGMAKEWILQDSVTPAETIIRMMFRSMSEKLYQLYFRTDESGQ